MTTESEDTEEESQPPEAETEPKPKTFLEKIKEKIKELRKDDSELYPFY